MDGVDIMLQGGHVLASVHVAIGAHLHLLIIVNEQVSCAAATAHDDIKYASARLGNVLLEHRNAHATIGDDLTTIWLQRAIDQFK